MSALSQLAVICRLLRATDMVRADIEWNETEKIDKLLAAINPYRGRHRAAETSTPLALAHPVAMRRTIGRVAVTLRAAAA